MERMLNPTKEFLSTAQKFPESSAIIDSHSDINFAALANLSLSFAQQFRINGVERGSTIGIRSADPAVVFASVFAAALLGCRWMYVDRRNLKTTIAETAKFFQTDVDQELQLPDAIEITPEWTQVPNMSPDALKFPGFENENDPWIIFSSSGTTGVPKLMEISCRSMVARIEATAHFFAEPKSRSAFLFPPHTAPTLIRALAALISGTGLVFSSDPKDWDGEGVTNVFGSPQQLRESFGKKPFTTKLKNVFVGGDGLSDGLAEKLFKNFDNVMNTYGSTETSLVLINKRYIDSKGSFETTTIWMDSEVQIMDESGNELPIGQDGIVRIRNGYLATEYLNNPSATDRAFREGWFYPGDIGLITKEGDFVATGRSSDIFNVGGVKTNAALIDFVLQTEPGVLDAISFLVPDEDGVAELLAFVELDGSLSLFEVNRDANLQITAKIGRESIPKRMLSMKKLPRNQNGKPNRLACTQMVLRARKEKTRMEGGES
jgi:acyl-CoA synthetase (AMP-forming)/AMP-acid ligase II